MTDKKTIIINYDKSKSKDKYKLRLIVDNKDIYFNNNIFQANYKDTNINIILDNDKIFWFCLNDILLVLSLLNIDKKKYNVKPFSDFSDDYFFDKHCEFINLKYLNKLICKCNNEDFQNWIENIVIPTLRNNESHLFDMDAQKKTFNKLNKKYLTLK